jgi:hypothetical protein
VWAAATMKFGKFRKPRNRGDAEARSFAGGFRLLSDLLRGLCG